MNVLTKVSQTARSIVFSPNQENIDLERALQEMVNLQAAEKIPSQTQAPQGDITTIRSQALAISELQESLLKLEKVTGAIISNIST